NAVSADDRDIGRLRIRLELARGSRTVHLWHAEVRHDQVEMLPAGRGPGRSGRRPRLEGLVALAGQYLDHDTAVVRVVLGEQHALCHPAELLSAEVPHAEQHGAAGESQEPGGGGGVPVGTRASRPRGPAARTRAASATRGGGGEWSAGSVRALDTTRGPSPASQRSSASGSSGAPSPAESDADAPSASAPSSLTVPETAAPGAAPSQRSAGMPGARSRPTSASRARRPPPARASR